MDVFTKPTWKEPILTKRCLIPATAFIEYSDNKIPYLIKHTHNKIFSFAGIWDIWKKGNDMIASFSIIATKANKVVESIGNSKNRMPFILKKDIAKKWLFNLDKDKIGKLLENGLDNNIYTYPLSRNISQKRYEEIGSKIFERWDY